MLHFYAKNSFFFRYVIFLQFLCNLFTFPEAAESPGHRAPRNRAEPSLAELGRDEPSRAQPSPAEHSRAEPNIVEPSRA